MNYKPLTILTFLVVFLVPGLLLAQSVYRPLVGVPGINPSSDFGTYINALYALSISVAALLAVIKIIIAGMKYMLSDMVTSKQDALSDIRGSITGLIVVISAVLILTVINPQLTETTIFLDPARSNPATPPLAPTPAAPVSGPGYTAVPYNVATEAAFRNSCLSAGNTFVTVYPNTTQNGTTMNVCYNQLPPAVVTQLESLVLPRDYDLIKDIYQKNIIPKQSTDSAVRPLIAAETASRDVSIGSIYMSTQHNTPPDWIDNQARSAMISACDALRRNISDPTLRANTEVVGNGSYYACVTLTPL